MSIPTHTVVIVPYDPSWPAVFASERDRLAEVFGGTAVKIEHIGSTAVPGLGAKPVIDILIGLDKLADAEDRKADLERLGYEYVATWEADIPDRRYFRKPLDGPDLFHLHAVLLGGEFWRRHLVFREHLRRHPSTAAVYLALKTRLAAEFGSDREGYTNAKTAFIQSVIQAAEREARVLRGAGAVSTIVKPEEFVRDDALRIRVAGPGDEQVLAALNRFIQELHLCARPDFFKPWQPAEVAAWFRSLLQQPGVQVWIAEVHGVPVGYVSTLSRERPEDPISRARRWCEIDHLAVAPHCQRRGIGRALVQTAVEAARAPGIDAVELTTWSFNATAQAAYRSYGFEPMMIRLELPPTRTAGV